MAAFNDLIAMRGVPEEKRTQTAANLVPVLNAFMRWRWNVLQFPLSYTPEQVLDAEHLLDGVPAKGEIPEPFWNASVTLRRVINERDGKVLTPEEENEKAALDAALARRKRADASVDLRIKKERKEQARQDSQNRPGGQEETFNSIQREQAAAVKAEMRQRREACDEERLGAAAHGQGDDRPPPQHVREQCGGGGGEGGSGGGSGGEGRGRRRGRPASAAAEARAGGGEGGG
jgi:hypothetical protein